MLGFFGCCGSGLRVAADSEPLLCPGRRRCAGAADGVAGGSSGAPASPGYHISLHRFSPRSWRSRRRAHDDQPLLSRRYASAPAALLEAVRQQHEAAELAAQRSRLAEPWQAARRRSR
ncbi:hypothetical protein ABPG75_013987 [Micractinium tetrahymenae]